MKDLAALGLISDFITKFPRKASEAFESFLPEQQLEIIEQLPASSSAILMKRVNPDIAAQLLQQTKSVIKIIKASDPALMVRILLRIEEKARKSILDQLPAGLAKEIEGLSSYPVDSAGSLMEVRFHVFHPSDSVNDVIERLRKARGYNISSVFLVDFDGVLQGRVYLQDLISAEANTLLKDIAKKTPWVQEMAPRDEIVEVVEKNQVPSIPVLNNDQVILGVIRYEQLVSIVHQDALDDLQKMVGVSKDEKALSTPFFSVRKRLPWLSVNLLTTFLAAFVVGVFEDTIAKITALAVLLPVVAGQSGNTGAQSQAVTMRGLALREIRLRHKWRVMVKEGTVGLINGAVIGALCSVSVLYWSQSAALAGVIGVAMVIAMVAASLSGAAIPMILTALGQDPATSSSIVLTTITDIVGFISFLGLATLFIGQLG